MLASKSGCQGFCQMGPLVTIFPENILYTRVKAEDVNEIVERTILDHAVVERLEYPLAVRRIRRAVQDAEALGIVGDDVFGGGLSLHFTVMEGAGAFVCGEETALIASAEGNRGMPKPKPPCPCSKIWHRRFN